ncbi:MAG: YbjN domain-containing protein [Eubacterium sp.]|nr:YbjN domain-containing protein [Eubacterium sp.]
MNNRDSALEVYNNLCFAIENRGWQYSKNEKDLSVTLEVTGDDLPMRFIITVDAPLQLVTLRSPFPFEIPENKRAEGAVAVRAISDAISNGSFDYNADNGKITYRLTVTFREGVAGEALLNDMINCACALVDMYNDKLLEFSKGYIELGEFLEKNS